MTWQLVSQSFRLLRTDPKLALFPVLSAVGVIALSLPFLLIVLTGQSSGVHWGAGAWLLVLAWYTAVSFLTIFCNCALAACVQMRLAGETPSIAAGLRRAGARVHVIFLWALVTSTVGRIIQVFEQRSGWTGRIVLGLIGVSWNLATFLIVPVLVMEDAGVFDSLRRSSALVRQTWGEQIVSGIVFGWYGLLCAVPGVVLGALGANGYPLFLVPAVLWFAALFAGFTAASEIFAVILYREASAVRARN
uniref:Uncharacterized protein n=1 Tax=Solibacter usitatus (strain Ellin6076) TaxID=234267 RepID=Q025E4_SOLUE